MAEDAFCGGGTKYFEAIQNHSKTTFSVMFCCAASGDLLPSMTLTVYKSPTGGFYKIWGEGEPEGSVYSANKTGWFDMEMFVMLFEKVRKYGRFAGKIGRLSTASTGTYTGRTK